MASVKILLLLSLAIISKATDPIVIQGEDKAEDDGGGEEKKEPIDVTGKDDMVKKQRVIPDDGLSPRWCGGPPGKTCNKPADIGSFPENDFSACLYKCQDLSCLSAQFVSGQCLLSSHRCKPSELTPGDGLNYYRLKEGETDCPKGLDPTGLNDFAPLIRYCKGEGVVCNGPDIIKPFFAATSRQCITRCNDQPRCRTAHFVDKTCHLKNKRCEQSELEESPGALDFYRLMTGEICPPQRPLNELEELNYVRKFCLMANRRCPGHSLYRQPQVVRPLEKCLIKCGRIKTCAGVDFFNNLCDPKEYRCTDAELTPVFGSANLMRLKEGEECPGNRRPPPENTAWSAKFCLRKKKLCPGEVMENTPFESPDYVDCLTKCVKSDGCQTALYKEKQCYLMSKRCEEDEYENIEVGDTYFRLRNAEKCPEESKPPSCPTNAVFKPDAPACPSDCKNPVAWKTCVLDTLPGCVCNEGFVLKEIGSDECVPLSSCNCYDHEGEEHEVGDIWRSEDCKTTFECTLSDEDMPVIIETKSPCKENEVCDSGACICADGYIRKDFKCQPSVECKGHSYFTPEASTTPNICHHTTREAVNSETKPGCHCNHGYILSEDGGECIPYSECGCKDTSDRIFEVGDTWVSADCSKENTCEPVSDSFPEIRSVETSCPDNSECTAAEGRGECECADGFTKETDGTCRKECEAPKVFKADATTCPDTCRLPHRSKSCATTAPACVCPEGQILNEDKQCVDKAACPCYDESGGKRMAEDQWMTNDCGAIKSCVVVDDAAVPTIKSEAHGCQEDAVCDTESGFPQCVCAEGFELSEDGEQCAPTHPPCEETLNNKVITFVSEIKSLMHSGCGSCSDTCRNPTASQRCPRENKICKCPKDNYLFDEQQSKCVPANECSCYDVLGNPHMPGSSWLSQDCNHLLTCISESSSVPSIKREDNECHNCDGAGLCLDID